MSDTHLQITFRDDLGGESIEYTSQQAQIKCGNTTIILTACNFNESKNEFEILCSYQDDDKINRHLFSMHLPTRD